MSPMRATRGTSIVRRRANAHRPLNFIGQQLARLTSIRSCESEFSICVQNRAKQHISHGLVRVSAHTREGTRNLPCMGTVRDTQSGSETLSHPCKAAPVECTKVSATTLGASLKRSMLKSWTTLSSTLRSSSAVCPLRARTATVK